MRSSTGRIVPSVAALPSSVGSSSEKKKAGGLSATILSAYDLTERQQPIAVTMRVCGMTVSTGAPSSRHKDHNSFRFNGNKRGNTTTDEAAGELEIHAPLRDLYCSTAEFAVEYENPSQRLMAKVKLDTMVIHETQWLILNLEGKNVDESSDGVTPTLRLKVKLHGPYRPEIAALVAMGDAWFGAMDHVEGSWSKLKSAVPTQNIPTISSKYILVPMAPLAAALVVMLPIVIGVMIVTLPVFLPFLVVVASVAAGALAVGSVVYFSTSTGRDQLATVFAPVFTTLMTTKSGQSLVYETGPRPTPVSLARIVVPKEMWGKLMMSLLIDLLGSASYLIPIVGEAADIAWAPIQTIFIMAMYDTISPNLKYVSFFEELLPLTDVIPSATIGWLTEYGPDLWTQGTKHVAGSLGVVTTSSNGVSVHPQQVSR